MQDTTNENSATWWRERYELALRDHQDDIRRIGEAAIEAAERHGLCHIFDDVIEELNQSLHVKLPMREHWYDGWVSMPVRFRCSPSEAGDRLEEIAQALFRYGDNQGGLEYTIQPEYRTFDLERFG